MAKKDEKSQQRYTITEQTRKTISLLSAIEDCSGGELIDKAIQFYELSNYNLKETFERLDDLRNERLEELAKILPSKKD